MVDDNEEEKEEREGDKIEQMKAAFIDEVKKELKNAKEEYMESLEAYKAVEEKYKAAKEKMEKKQNQYQSLKLKLENDPMLRPCL